MRESSRSDERLNTSNQRRKYSSNRRFKGETHRSGTTGPVHSNGLLLCVWGGGGGGGGGGAGVCVCVCERERERASVTSRLCSTIASAGFNERHSLCHAIFIHHYHKYYFLSRFCVFFK